MASSQRDGTNLEVNGCVLGDFLVNHCSIDVLYDESTIPVMFLGTPNFQNLAFCQIS